MKEVALRYTRIKERMGMEKEGKRQRERERERERELGSQPEMDTENRHYKLTSLIDGVLAEGMAVDRKSG
jgi:hypothetical protein